ncbi:hypothetical protein M2G23_08190 [Vibrio vulnificus]|uniref:hypothetical protein n=1 Tax=Vibrio vulnificus TaxID=672 RepID=UPI001CDC0402|nr:hypothetical protein [Vibrio vulnificus]MCU8177909.1 hypothetical protein [Vibrio vulnificus]MCU8334852.1 hypothetical protein [Vibrio vulnificus]MCU8391349.1 hypothetical protein [Vibrio vulnificus]MCU8413107.1 hypothetical protein [Vibrio vulnificus]MCU8549055.1 hypothetical protein [Vibrio vulnificus]
MQRFLFFAAELSSAFSFLISSSSRARGPIAQQVVWLSITASLPVLLLVLLYAVVYCGECVFKTQHPAHVDKWFPVCTGMTAGGVVVGTVELRLVV